MPPTPDVVPSNGRKVTKLGWKENKDQTLLIETVETGAMNFTKGDDSPQIAI